MAGLMQQQQLQQQQHQAALAAASQQQAAYYGQEVDDDEFIGDDGDVDLGIPDDYGADGAFIDESGEYREEGKTNHSLA